MLGRLNPSTLENTMEALHRLPFSLYAALAACLLYVVLTAVRAVYFHPLSHIPGPKLWIAFPIFKSIAAVTGNKDEKIRSFHEKYGSVVRYSPDEVTFITASAWHDIYGHRNNVVMPKSRGRKEPGRPDSLLMLEPEEHARLRKLLAPAFSDQALKGQESLIQSYVDELIEVLRTAAAEGRAVDTVNYMNFTTFDIIGDLSLGQPFGGLKTLSFHKWVASLLSMIQTGPVIEEGLRYPGLLQPFKKMMGKTMMAARNYLWDFAAECVDRRLQDESKKRRSDLVGAMDSYRGTPEEMAREDMIANVSLFIMAGSETTATLLTGLIYWLLRTSKSLEQVKKEIRSAFAKKSDITILAVSDSKRVPYLHACIEEALRIYPPLVTSTDRITTLPVSTVSGVNIPAGYKIGVHHSAAYWSDSNFTRPREFLPQRFLKEAREDPQNEFHNDNRDVFHPFSFGPRNCAGKNLAYAEMRLFMAKVLWNFDLSFAENMDVEGWERQKSFIVWQKKPVWIKLKARE